MSASRKKQITRNTTIYSTLGAIKEKINARNFSDFRFDLDHITLSERDGVWGH